MVLVVAVLPVGDADLGVQQSDPLVHVQAFVTDSVVERFDEAVAPGFTWWDVADADLVLAERPERVGDEFGAVVTANQHRFATRRDDVDQRGDDVVAGDGSVGDVEQ